MEDALALDAQKYGAGVKQWVLILVVMEDALALLFNHLYETEKRVLILVVMEDALAQRSYTIYIR